jgi:mono/diheme cytochrome c family protein
VPGFLAPMALCDAFAQDISATTYPQQSGEAVYKSICQGCHMPDARGANGAGAYPALARDVRLASAIYAVGAVINGQRAMPPFSADLSDVQIANVVNYIRTSFGNDYKDSVAPETVRAQRRSHQE